MTGTAAALPASADFPPSFGLLQQRLPAQPRLQGLQLRALLAMRPEAWPVWAYKILVFFLPDKA